MDFTILDKTIFRFDRGEAGISVCSYFIKMIINSFSKSFCSENQDGILVGTIELSQIETLEIDNENERGFNIQYIGNFTRLK